MWQLKNSICDTNRKLKLWQDSKTQIVTKLKMWQNSSCDKAQIETKLKLWQNYNYEKNYKCDKTKIVTKLINSNYDKTPKLKLWQNSKLKLWQNLKYDKSQVMKIKKTLLGSFSKNILTPWQPMRCSLGSVFRFSQCLYERCPWVKPFIYEPRESPTSIRLFVYT